MATPHINAEPGDFAADVLMPGDPRRAMRIAETVLDDARLVTEVRGVLGYTGTVQGRPISVLASGMGMPSMTIYATELFRFFGVQRIIRIGTAGGMAPHLDVGDVVIASAAHTDSAMSAGRSWLSISTVWVTVSSRPFSVSFTSLSSATSRTRESTVTGWRNRTLFRP